MLWAQMFADILKLPVEIIETKELGTLGCAMAAAVAAGKYGDITEAAAKMVKIKQRLEPNCTNYEVYDKKYMLYKKVSEILDNTCYNFNS